MFVDEESSELCLKGYKGLDESKIGQAPIKIGDQIEDLIELHRSGINHLVSKYHHGSLNIDGTIYQSDYFLSAPIHVGDHWVGVFNVSDKKSEHGKIFTELDLKILLMIVRQVKVAIANAKLYKHLKDLTLTDSLTGAHNYRFFIQTFDYEIVRAKRYKRNLSLLMIDIDYLKSYNDSFGHLEGDDLLKKVAKTMKENVREVDSVCRYAGDEFVVILPETDFNQAIITAEKIRKQISLLELKRPITLSIGVTQCDPQGSRHDHVHRADNALSSAKKEGRNKVVGSARQQ
jgi:diguanylate cyclase (GGDEF)-like protein